MERGVEQPVLYRQHVQRRLLDVPGDPTPVIQPPNISLDSANGPSVMGRRQPRAQRRKSAAASRGGESGDVSGRPAPGAAGCGACAS